MKTYSITFLIILIAQTANGIDKDNFPGKGTLIVNIVGFENNNGNCWFALDKIKEVYESEDSVFIGKILPIISGEVIINIASLEYGYYAIRVFHDENSNAELDSNFLGIPTEDYGFSNNAGAWFGAPSWERAKFLFNRKEMAIEISVD
ncbi:MAG: DUF2141 domain-containing protein [Ignavibacteria bacterium]|nr:DUF2141 domain-containing protein [Ignavibacteria bacterium]